MKLDEILVEYKNKYYKPVPKKPKPRPQKNLWFDDYNRWAADIKTRFPDAIPMYDEENEEVIASSSDNSVCYGKWSSRAKNKKGLSFHEPRKTYFVTRNHKKLVKYV